MIVVMGCGNAARSDDGVGPEVVRLLSQGALAGDSRVRLLDAGTDGMAVMFAARGCASLFVVDAVRAGSAPGAVYEVPGEELARAREPSLSVHDFRWQDALFAGRKMWAADFPADVTVLLVEAASIDYGMSLSPAVSASARQVAQRIEGLARMRLARAS